MGEISRDPRAARRGLAIYFAILIAGSAFLEWRILRSGQPIAAVPLLIVALMFVPAAASVVARLALAEGFGDVSFRLGGRDGFRAMLLGWAYPMLVGFAAYGLAWAMGLADFQRPLPPASHIYQASAAANLLASFLMAASFGTAVSCLTAFGEELGWRGYMLTRLIDAGVPKPVFASGLIWACWHVPMILSGQYAAGSQPAVSALLFVIGVVAMAYLAAYLRLRSGSVWPSVVQHGAWNAIIQGTFDRATVGTPLSVGEAGWLTMVASIVVVLFMTRGVWTLQRQPGEPLALPIGRPPSTLSV